MKSNVQNIVERHKTKPRYKPLIEARIVGPKVVRSEKLSKETIASEGILKAKKGKIWKGLLPYTLKISTAGYSNISVFACYRHVLRHINKHMFHKEEGVLWELLCPKAKGQMKKQLSLKSNPRSQVCPIDLEDMQVLYDAYAIAVEEAVNDAVKFGCYTKNGTSAYYLGLSGLLVIIEKGVVKTAYFPLYIDSNFMATPRKFLTLKQKRENVIRERARKKREKKGTPERRLFKYGFKSTLRYFDMSECGYTMKRHHKELLRLAEQFMPLEYHRWKVIR